MTCSLHGWVSFLSVCPSQRPAVCMGGFLSCQCAHHKDLQSAWVGFFLVSVPITKTCSLHGWVSFLSVCPSQRPAVCMGGFLSCQCAHHKDLQSAWEGFFLVSVPITKTCSLHGWVLFLVSVSTNDLQSAWEGPLSSQRVHHNDLQSAWEGPLTVPLLFPYFMFGLSPIIRISLLLDTVQSCLYSCLFLCISTAICNMWLATMVIISFCIMCILENGGCGLEGILIVFGIHGFP